MHLMENTARPRSQAGQSLAEMAVIAGSVLLVTIPALVLLKDSIGENVTHLLSVKAPPAQVLNPPGQMAPQGDGNTLPLAGGYVSPSVITVRGANGSVIRLDVPVDVAESVQTVGANGTVELLATSIKAMATQLLAEGKIEESGANALINLANLAHRQAAIAAIVDQAMQNAGGDTSAVLAMTVQFEGNAYRLPDLANLIATGSANPNGTYNYGLEISKFWNAYTGLWDAGAMKDPVAAGVVDTYVKEIANLTDSNRVILYKMSTGYGGTPDVYRKSQAEYLQSIGFGNTAQLLENHTGSQVTHQNAAGICGTGGHRDSGRQCSG